MNPYAWAIMQGIKRYETRSWKPYAGIDHFVLHAGLGSNIAAQTFIKQHVPDWPEIKQLPRGVALGIAKIIAVHKDCSRQC